MANFAIINQKMTILIIFRLTMPKGNITMCIILKGKYTMFFTARDITKTYSGVYALKNITMEFEEGEIHAIVGENGAGKSTLIKIIAGAEQADSGELFMNNFPCRIKNPQDSVKNGIAVVYQELSLFENMTVAENIFAGNLPVNIIGSVDRKKMFQKAQDIGDSFGIAINPKAYVRDLSAGDRQIVEILRALSYKARILLLDEPTSSLTQREAEKLNHMLKKIKEEKKTTVIYISHKLDEVLLVADRVSVLRDGNFIGTVRASDVKETDLIKMMVGREVNLYTKKIGTSRANVPILDVQSLSDNRKIASVSFTLHQGEILGFFGLIGAGRSEIAQTIMGLRKASSGTVLLKGEPITRLTTEEIIQKGIMYVYENRKEAGIFAELGIRENVIAPQIKNFSNRGIINYDKSTKFACQCLKDFNIVCNSVNQPVKTLSGGNQQKVLLSMWMVMQPEVLIVDEPTRGIDVGAKSEIHALLKKFADCGMGIILISSELPEIMALSDRVIVIHEGKLSGYAVGENINEEYIMALAAGIPA